MPRVLPISPLIFLFHRSIIHPHPSNRKSHPNPGKSRSFGRTWVHVWLNVRLNSESQVISTSREKSHVWSDVGLRLTKRTTNQSDFRIKSIKKSIKSISPLFHFYPYWYCEKKNKERLRCPKNKTRQKGSKVESGRRARPLAASREISGANALPKIANGAAAASCKEGQSLAKARGRQNSSCVITYIEAVTPRDFSDVIAAHIRRCTDTENKFTREAGGGRRTRAEFVCSVTAISRLVLSPRI